MGWTQGHKPENVREWVNKMYAVTNEVDQITQRCLDAAMVNMKDIYVAIERKDKYGITSVSADVIHIKFINEREDGENYSQMLYKFVSENSGPVAYHCPERILKLLTPTESQWANEWREANYANLERRKQGANLKVGDYVQFEEEIYFKNQDPVTVFKIEQKWNGQKRLMAISSATGEKLFAAKIPGWKNKYTFKKLEEADFPWTQSNGMRP